MTLTPPKHGDVRVCVVSTQLPEHALAQSVPDTDTAKSVYDAITALLVLQTEHGLHDHHYSVEVQMYLDDYGWTELLSPHKEN